MTQRERERERERDRGFKSLPLLTRALIPTWGLYPHDHIKPNHLAKAPPPNTIALGIKSSTYDFWGDTNIQSTARGRKNTPTWMT